MAKKTSKRLNRCVTSYLRKLKTLIMIEVKNLKNILKEKNKNIHDIIKLPTPHKKLSDCLNSSLMHTALRNLTND